MKAQRVKWIIFILLLVVFVYIWWGNIKMFTSSQPSTYYRVTANEDNPSADTIQPQDLEFVEPKTNPFKRYDNTPAQKPTARQPAPPQPTVPAPSSQLRLVGAIAGGSQPQAIFQHPDGSTLTVALRDSVLSWQVVAVYDTLVVLAHEKQRDTLILHQTQ